MKKVAIFSPVYPRVGGIASHSLRLQRFLSQKGHKAIVVDLKLLNALNEKGVFKRLGLPELFFLVFAANNWHVQLSSPIINSILIVLGFFFRKRVIYTHHNNRRPPTYFLKIMSFFSVHTIFVNGKLGKELDKEIPPDFLSIIPAYIPSSFDMCDVGQSANIAHVDRTSPTIFMIATSYAEFEGHDLYGVRFACRALSMLASSHLAPDFNFVVIDTTGKYKSTMESSSSALLRERTYYFDRAINIQELLKFAQLFIRPTMTDGDALSVREALCSGCNVLCSDVVERPQNAVVYRSLDFNDFLFKTKELLNKERSLASDNEGTKFADSVISIYQ
ncbi:hypothetical protein [Aliidiomarina haloalkalitolerans]|uniref:Glycosyl transferase family 1 domain-containing protein n=1 Tax=Aliidiomarina haloalkalitolerans TaxID=859059 RepID=A0A432VR01_9GAMM|nr:hypothetical protein [Aliidiomarina haloalkalitolerans]RUO18675.1 hypothetical protein CWE06_10555 [Aliidiomarina haloalkalitolerans]